MPRFKSKENLDLIRSLPCVVCFRDAPSDPDHFKTRGAGGGDELSNLNPLCRRCHGNRHMMGIKTFMLRFGDIIELRRAALGLPKLKGNP